MPDKPLLGAHMSISGGVYTAPARGEELGCTAIQIFTKNANRWDAKPLSEEDVSTYNEELSKTGIRSVVAHDSYLINLCSPVKELLEKSRKAFLIEMERCELLSIPALVTHPGSHVGSGEETGIKGIAASLDWLHENFDGTTAKVALETTAGQGTNLGYTFEQIARMIELTKQPDRLVVCLDTCHVFSAGYDIRTEETYNVTIEKFDAIIGLDRLACVHMNDSKFEFEKKKDRHEGIGEGYIGLDGFKFIMNDERLKDIPKVMETPKGDDGKELDIVNLKKLRSLLN